MTHINEGWTVMDTGAECTDGMGEAWESWVTFGHADGREVHIITNHSLYGEVTLYGDRVGFEAFVTDVDDTYTAEVERLMEDGENTLEDVERELGRSYFIASQYDTFSASNADTDWPDPSDPEENHHFIEDIDYFGSFEDMDDSVVLDVLQRYAEREAQSHLAYTDLDDMWANLMEIMG